MQLLRAAVRGVAGAAAAILTLVVAFKAQYWVGSDREVYDHALQALADSPYLLLATGCWIAVLFGPKRAARALLLGLLSGPALGGVSAILGFFGYVLFMPHSEQALVFAIFLALPLGIVVGMIGGAIYGAWRPAERESKQSA